MRLAATTFWAVPQICGLITCAAADVSLGNFERTTKTSTPLGPLSLPTRIEVIDRTEGASSKIGLKLAVNLSSLQTSVEKSLALPRDNCRSFSNDNPVVRQVNSTVSIDAEKLKLGVTGEVVVWACAENPIPNTRVEWKERKVGPGIVTRVPEVVTTKGPPVRTSIGAQQYSLAASFGFKLTREGKVQADKSSELRGTSDNLLKSENALKAALQQGVDNLATALTALGNVQTALGDLNGELGRLPFVATAAGFVVQDGQPFAHFDFTASAPAGEISQLRERLQNAARQSN